MDWKLADHRICLFMVNPLVSQLCSMLRSPLCRRSLFSGLSPKSKTHLPAGSATWSMAWECIGILFKVMDVTVCGHCIGVAVSKMRRPHLLPHFLELFTHAAWEWPTLSHRDQSVTFACLGWWNYSLFTTFYANYFSRRLSLLVILTLTLRCSFLKCHILTLHFLIKRWATAYIGSLAGLCGHFVNIALT